jgi:hypothetical protein
MSIPIEELQSTLTSVQEELQRVRQRLAELEKVVSIDTDDAGIRRVCIECHDLLVRPAHEPRLMALNLSSDSEGGYLHLYRKGEARICTELSLDMDGAPQIVLRGADSEPRVSIFEREDCGFIAAHTEAGRPSALMRAQPNGGSVAVLQKDGQMRGVLMHHDATTSEDGRLLPAATNLIFADEEQHTTVKLHSDGGGGLFSLGPPGRADALVAFAREDGSAVILHSPSEQSSVCLMALETSAQILVHEGKVPGSGYEACVAASAAGSSLTLRGEGSEKAVDISSLDQASSITLHDQEGEPRVMLAHHHGSHSALTLQSTGEEDGVRAIASEEVSSIELMSPIDPETKILNAVTAEKAVSIMQRKRRPLIMFGEGDQGGIICTYGSSEGQPGIATLSGGPVTGSLLLSTADGTPQLTLDSTDHGGRLLINNDLGFQRVALGVHAEAGGLHLNNTGSIGIQAVASPKGGIIIVNDPDGDVVATLPEDTNEDATGWGRLPESF